MSIRNYGSERDASPYDDVRNSQKTPRSTPGRFFREQIKILTLFVVCHHHLCKTNIFVIVGETKQSGYYKRICISKYVFIDFHATDVDYNDKWGHVIYPSRYLVYKNTAELAV